MTHSALWKQLYFCGTTTVNRGASGWRGCRAEAVALCSTELLLPQRSLVGADELQCLSQRLESSEGTCAACKRSWAGGRCCTAKKRPPRRLPHFSICLPLSPWAPQVLRFGDSPTTAVAAPSGAHLLCNVSLAAARQALYRRCSAASWGPWRRPLLRPLQPALLGASPPPPATTLGPAVA